MDERERIAKILNSHIDSPLMAESVKKAYYTLADQILKPYEQVCPLCLGLKEYWSDDGFGYNSPKPCTRCEGEGKIYPLLEKLEKTRKDCTGCKGEKHLADYDNWFFGDTGLKWDEYKTQFPCHVCHGTGKGEIDWSRLVVKEEPRGIDEITTDIKRTIKSAEGQITRYEGQS